MTEVLRIAGAVAGIGGLTVAILLLVYRQIIQKINPPKSPKQELYFSMINRIILFTFIVAIVGMIVYAFLEFSQRAEKAGERADKAGEKAQEAFSETAKLTGKLAALQAENANLQSNYTGLNESYKKQQAYLDSIVEPSLKVRSSGIEVMRTEIEFDFSKWALVPDDQWATNKGSEVVLRTKRTISRAQPEATKFHATYATSSPFDPVFKCSTHKLTPIANLDPFPAGKQAMKRWILEYDISTTPLFHDVLIETEVTAWNTHQNPTRESEETLILFPTRSASITLRFGDSKRPVKDKIECFFYRLGIGESPTQVQSNQIAVSMDNSLVHWEIATPRLGFHYRVEWKW